MNGTREIRRYQRFKGWDYSKGASFFITIVTAPRRPLFGRVEGGRVLLSPLGLVVNESLEAIPRLNPGISLFGYVVMPDHVHLNIHLAAGLAEPLKILGKAIGRFKVFTTKQAKIIAGLSPALYTGALASGESRAAPGGSGESRAAPGGLWQQGYHDWLCLSRGFIDATERYIAYNPMKWELMYGAPGALRIHEPLFSPRLDPADYWKGVGNLALLAPDSPVVSLRVSREVRDAAAISAVVRRMEDAVAKGFAVISGFISPGERAVRDMLCRRKDARFIRMLPSCIPNKRFRPESRYVEAFAENRYLEIARGNDETEFGRRACLDLNEEIVKIATAAHGIALYWLPDGPRVIERNGV